jgi:hypothetical protein
MENTDFIYENDYFKNNTIYGVKKSISSSNKDTDKTQKDDYIKIDDEYYEKPITYKRKIGYVKEQNE